MKMSLDKNVNLLDLSINKRVYH